MEETYQERRDRLYQESLDYWNPDKICTEERQLLQEPDYREIAATEAGKLNHNSVQEYLSDCDKIYNWLIQDKKEKKRYNDEIRKSNEEIEKAIKNW